MANHVMQKRRFQMKPKRLGHKLKRAQMDVLRQKENSIEIKNYSAQRHAVIPIRLLLEVLLDSIAERG
jgi:hypothetical protein